MAIPSIPNLQCDTTPETHHQNFMRFINGVNFATENDNLFSIAGTPYAFLFDERRPSVDRGTVMFIRPCYDAFIAEIMANWFPQEQGAEPVAVVATGTGGVGKTSLRIILCKRIMERINQELVDVGARASIIFQNGGVRRFYQAQFERGIGGTMTVACSQEETGSDEFVGDIPHRVYYLVDAPQGDISKASTITRLTKDRAAFFSSPSWSLMKCLHKTYKATALYMPLWGFEELCDASLALGLNITVPVINERYKLLGGVARHVLEVSTRAHDIYVKQSVEGAIAAMSIVDNVAAISNKMNLGLLVSYVAVHVKVGRQPNGEYDFMIARNMWASKQIVLMIAERATQALKREMQAETSIFQNKFNQTISGYVYELYAIQLLKVERLSGLRIHTMKDRNVVPTVTRRLRRALGVPAGPRFLERFARGLAQGPATRVRFVHDDEMDAALSDAEAGDIIIPTNFMYPVIDCVLVFPSADGAVLLYLFVQVALASRHHIPGPVATQRLQTMITVCGGVDCCALAFFVPPRWYDRFLGSDRQVLGANVTQLRMTIGP